jgi:hypothetical protein
MYAGEVDEVVLSMCTSMHGSRGQWASHTKRPVSEDINGPTF